jgi:hypothetical protein
VPAHLLAHSLSTRGDELFELPESFLGHRWISFRAPAVRFPNGDLRSMVKIWRRLPKRLLSDD